MPDPTLEALLLQKAQSIGPDPTFDRSNLKLGMMQPPNPWMGGKVVPSPQTMLDELERLAYTKVGGWARDKVGKQYHNLASDGLMPGDRSQVIPWLMGDKMSHDPLPPK